MPLGPYVKNVPHHQRKKKGGGDVLPGADCVVPQNYLLNPIPCYSTVALDDSSPSIYILETLKRFNLQLSILLKLFQIVVVLSSCM